VANFGVVATTCSQRQQQQQQQQQVDQLHYTCRSMLLQACGTEDAAGDPVLMLSWQGPDCTMHVSPLLLQT
jgi:hypothetical protein